MYFEIKNIIFTDETKAKKKLIDKNKNPFFMLHLEVIEGDKATISANEHGKWISKFYSDDKDKNMIMNKIKIGSIYQIEYKQSGIYKNIISVRDKENNIII